MDLKADPCEDFYQYACGGWVKNNPIPDSKWSHKVFTILHEQNQQVVKTVLGDLIAKRKNASSIGITKAAKFYQSCMKTDVIEGLGDEPLKKLIQTYNSWPVTNSSFNPATWNFEDTFTRIHKHLSMAPLFKMFVGEDIKNSSVNIINFDQSGIRMRRDIYLKNGTVHYTARKAYQVLMKKIVRLLGANDTQVKYMDEIYEFEKKLANKFQSVLERRNYRSIYQTMTVAEFANATEIPVEWLKVWLADMFSETNSTVPLSERVVSYSTNYIKSAWKLFNQLKPEVKAAYIMWTPVYTFAGTLRGKYKEAFDEFRKNVYGVTAEAPRWEMCISATSKAFGFALGRLFVDKTFTQGAKDTAEEMIRAIRKVFIENIDNLDWMDQPTKTKAKSKAEGIIQNIGYPNFIKNDTQLNMYYDGLIVHEGKYFENILNRRRFYSLKSYEKRGKPVDKSQWSTLPSQVNAYYFQTKNKIVFPAGILQPPLYDPMAPRALNYGAIGMIVGHEITHGFDDQGKNFNKEGNFQNWWTNSSEKEFDERARCLANQYSRYSLYGKNLNGNQTLGENIADNGGIKEAFQAYRNWVKKNGEEKKLPGIDLTPDQLYFIGFAQIWCSNYRMQAAIHQLEAGVHSISKYRVIGSLHNLEYFAKAYNCPVGSNMNPKEKCSIW